MASDVAPQQPWVSCHLTALLIRHAERTGIEPDGLDFASIFHTLEGLQAPPDPRAFLTDVGNWVPLAVLRELTSRCERLSGQKDFAYHAARAWFAPGREPTISLLEVLFRVLHDVRSVLVSASLWATVHTNYLKLQSFEVSTPEPAVCLLAQFVPPVPAMISSLGIIKGYTEGFPRLYPGIQEVHCLEEFSQLRLEDAVAEFPDYAIEPGDRLTIVRRADGAAVATAVRIPLRAEMVRLPPAFAASLPEALVAPPVDGRLTVLTAAEGAGGEPVAWAYRMEGAATLADGALAYPLPRGAIFNAPYTRLRMQWHEEAAAPVPSADAVRRELSDMLFEHLREARRTQMRMVQHNVEKRTLALENLRLRQAMEREYGIDGLIGQSRPMREIFRLVRSIAGTDVTVLVQGETGTGKELIARAIHQQSVRQGKRFVAVNCGALTETLLESELFGHERGAFTGAAARREGVFEAANGGTLFLDEIGEIPPATQVRLLRVLQEGEFQRVGGSTPIRVDVRVISATNQDLDELVRLGRFRQDLYYRLRVFPLRVPPLRERTEDIPRLVAHFIEKSNLRMRKSVRSVSGQALAALTAYRWPGNVRELENAVQRMMVLVEGETLESELLPSEIAGVDPGMLGVPSGLKGVARQSAEAAERAAVEDALEQTGGNVTHAAKQLGISRATLQKRMKAFGLRSRPGRAPS